MTLLGSLLNGSGIQIVFSTRLFGTQSPSPSPENCLTFSFLRVVLCHASWSFALCTPRLVYSQRLKWTIMKICRVSSLCNSLLWYSALQIPVASGSPGSLCFLNLLRALDSAWIPPLWAMEWNLPTGRKLRQWEFLLFSQGPQPCGCFLSNKQFQNKLLQKEMI